MGGGVQRVSEQLKCLPLNRLDELGKLRCPVLLYPQIVQSLLDHERVDVKGFSYRSRRNAHGQESFNDVRELLLSHDFSAQTNSTPGAALAKLHMTRA